MPTGARKASFELAQLTADLQAIPREIRREIGPEFLAAAQPVLADARRRASWSRRIPPAMKVKTRRQSLRPGVVFTVDIRRAPHAPLYEFGQGRSSTSFRHPVFGNRRVWVAQATRRSIGPAVRAGRPRFVRASDRAVVKAARRHGFR